MTPFSLTISHYTFEGKTTSSVRITAFFSKDQDVLVDQSLVDKALCLSGNHFPEAIMHWEELLIFPLQQSVNNTVTIATAWYGPIVRVFQLLWLNLH